MLSTNKLFKKQIQEVNQEEFINKLKNIEDPYLKGALVTGVGGLTVKHFKDRNKKINQNYQKSDSIENLVDLYPREK